MCSNEDPAQAKLKKELSKEKAATERDLLCFLQSPLNRENEEGNLSVSQPPSGVCSKVIQTQFCFLGDGKTRHSSLVSRGEEDCEGLRRVSQGERDGFRKREGGGQLF